MDPVLAGAVAGLREAQSVDTAAFVESYAREHAFSGTVLVERNGRVEYERSFDMADRPPA